mgnify:CR=1 FL=1
MLVQMADYYGATSLLPAYDSYLAMHLRTHRTELLDRSPASLTGYKYRWAVLTVTARCKGGHSPPVSTQKGRRAAAGSLPAPATELTALLSACRRLWYHRAYLPLQKPHMPAYVHCAVCQWSGCAPTWTWRPAIASGG